MDSTSGLFYASRLNAYGSKAKDGFCKPINIRVYSAPPPVRMRVVTYEMAYWESNEQPDLMTQWDQAHRYRSAGSGHRTFSFTVGTLPMDLETILTEIRRHFHAIVLQNKSCRIREDGIDRMLTMNTAEKYYTNERGEYFRVFDVHHVVLVKINEDKAHYIASQRVRYKGEYRDGQGLVKVTDQYVTAPLTYHDNRDMCKRALNHLSHEDTIARLLNAN